MLSICSNLAVSNPRRGWGTTTRGVSDEVVDMEPEEGEGVRKGFPNATGSLVTVTGLRTTDSPKGCETGTGFLATDTRPGCESELDGL